MENVRSKKKYWIQIITGTAFVLSLWSAAALVACAPAWPRPEGQLMWRSLRSAWATFSCFIGPLPLCLLLLSRSPEQREVDELLGVSGFLLAALLAQSLWVTIARMDSPVARWAIWGVLLQLFLLTACRVWCKQLDRLVQLAVLFCLVATLPSLAWSALCW